MEKRTCKTCNKSYPLTEEHFHKDKLGLAGFKRICKRCRRLSEASRWRDKAADYNAKRKAEYAKAKHRRCKQCKRTKALDPKYWQREGRKASGFRQPCKACLVKRKGKISLDEKPKP